MRDILQRVRNFLVRDDGPTSVEYAVLIGVIIMVVMLTIQTIGTITSSSFNDAAQSLANGSSQHGGGGSDERGL